MLCCFFVSLLKQDLKAIFCLRKNGLAVIPYKIVSLATPDRYHRNRILKSTCLKRSCFLFGRAAMRRELIGSAIEFTQNNYYQSTLVVLLNLSAKPIRI